MIVGPRQERVICMAEWLGTKRPIMGPGISAAARVRSVRCYAASKLDDDMCQCMSVGTKHCVVGKEHVTPSVYADIASKRAVAGDVLSAGNLQFSSRVDR